MPSVEWNRTRLSSTLGITASVLCGIVGGVLITVGSHISGWIIIGGVVIVGLAMWSLAVSVMKAKSARQANLRH